MTKMEIISILLQSRINAMRSKKNIETALSDFYLMQ